MEDIVQSTLHGVFVCAQIVCVLFRYLVVVFCILDDITTRRLIPNKIKNHIIYEYSVLL